MVCVLALLLCLLSWAPSQAQQLNLVAREHSLASGLVAWWRAVPGFTMGITFYDLMGFTNGTLMNMQGGLGPISGWSGTAREGGYMQMNFNTDDDYITFGTAPVLSDLPQKTIACWIYLKSFGGGSLARILDKQTSNGWFLQVNNSEIVNGFSLLQDATSFYKWGVANTLTLNTWTHIAVVYDNTGPFQPVFYVNGVNQASVTTITAGSGAALSDAASTLYLGDNATATRILDGSVDDIRIYNRLMTPGQVRLLYNLSLQGDPGLLMQPGLQAVAYAPLVGNPDFFPFFRPPHLGR